MVPVWALILVGFGTTMNLVIAAKLYCKRKAVDKRLEEVRIKAKG